MRTSLSLTDLSFSPDLPVSLEEMLLSPQVAGNSNLGFESYPFLYLILHYCF